MVISAGRLRLAAGALLLVLAACTPAAPGPTGKPAATQAPAASGASVTLRLLMSAGEPAQSSTRALADRFQAANPGVRVEIAQRTLPKRLAM